MQEDQRIQKRKSLSRHFRPSKFSRKDIDELFRLVKENCSGARIETEDYIYTGFAVFLADRQSVTELLIKGDDPYISVEINTDQVWLYAAEDNLKAYGTFKKLEDALLRCERKPRLLFSGWFNAFIIASLWIYVVWNALTLYWYGIQEQPRRIELLRACIGITLFAASLWNFYATGLKFRRNMINLAEYQEIGFASRNKDQIIMALISTVFSALVGGIIAAIW